PASPVRCSLTSPNVRNPRLWPNSRSGLRSSSHPFIPHLPMTITPGERFDLADSSRSHRHPPTRAATQGLGLYLSTSARSLLWNGGRREMPVRRALRCSVRSEPPVRSFHSLRLRRIRWPRPHAQHGAPWRLGAEGSGALRVAAARRPSCQEGLNKEL